MTSRPFEVGQSFQLEFHFTKDNVLKFANVCGDVNPIHIDEEFARATPFGGTIVHGMYAGSLISAILGNHFPGPGTIYVSQEMRFLAPIMVGSREIVECALVEIGQKNRAQLRTQVRDLKKGTLLVDGSASVLLPRSRS